MIGQLLFLLFVNDSPRYPRSTDAALCGLCQKGNTADTEHESSQFSYYRMGLVEEMGPTDKSYQLQMPHNWAWSSPEVFIFTAMSLAQPSLYPNKWVQTVNLFSPSARGFEAANKARRLTILVRRSFQGLSKSPFIPLCWALVCVHPRCGVPSINQWVESCVHSHIPTTNYHRESHDFCLFMLFDFFSWYATVLSSSVLSTSWIVCLCTNQCHLPCVETSDLNIIG